MTNSYGMGRKTLKSYVIGLFLSLILTLFSFSIVIFHSLPVISIVILLAILAILQLITQVVCFLRMNTRPEGRWNLMPFLFTILIISVLVIGSLWIMYNLNYNMIH